MRKSLVAGIVLAGALAAWYAAGDMAARAGDESYADISQFVAGCYMADVSYVGRQPVGAAPNRPKEQITDIMWWKERSNKALFSVDSGGGVLSNDTSEQGDPVEGLLFSSFHGTWTQVAGQAISIERLGFGFDDLGNHVVTWKIIAPEITFDNDFTRASGSFVIEAYHPTLDPLDPSSAPSRFYDGEVTLRRF